MENKITAVEWLIGMINYTSKDTFYAMKESGFLQQAKQMEKEQIKDGFVECWLSNVPDGIECKLDAEQYYNETYGK